MIVFTNTIRLTHTSLLLPPLSSSLVRFFLLSFFLSSSLFQNFPTPNSLNPSGYFGAAACLVLGNFGAAIGTYKSALGIYGMAVRFLLLVALARSSSFRLLGGCPRVSPRKISRLTHDEERGHRHSLHACAINQQPSGCYSQGATRYAAILRLNS